MTTRRSNGEGHPRKRADGRWEVQIAVNGERRSLYGKTRQEVLRKRKDLDLAPRSHTTETLRDLAAVWLANVVEPHRAKLTRITYDQYLRTHILPVLGDKRLGDIRPADVERLLAGMRRIGKADATIQSAMGVLRVLLNYAVRTERLARNPASLVPVKVPKPREVTAPSPAQVRAFLAAIEGDDYGPIFLCILALGLRRGEALGLTWDCIDFKNNIVHVRKALKWIPHEGFELGELKRRTSRRDLHLPEPLKVAITKVFDRQCCECLHYSQYGRKYDDWKLVFRTQEGRPVGQNYALRRLRRALRRAGLPEGLRLHDLRHHYASILFAQGVEPKTIQEQLGHANLGVTMNVYTHLLPKSRRDASERVWAYLEGE
jgi:integrase